MTEGMEPREDQRTQAGALVEALRDRLLTSDESEDVPDPEVVTITVRDGRMYPPNPKGFTPAQLQDFAAILDGVAVEAVSKQVALGNAEEVSGLEPWSLLGAARPRSPIEAAVLRALVLAGAQQRQLVALSGRYAAGSDAGRRYAELGLRAAREVCRTVEVWRKLRQPASVNVGLGGQANVVGGDQHIHGGAKKSGGTD